MGDKCVHALNNPHIQIKSHSADYHLNERNYPFVNVIFDNAWGPCLPHFYHLLSSSTSSCAPYYLSNSWSSLWLLSFYTQNRLRLLTLYLCLGLVIWDLITHAESIPGENGFPSLSNHWLPAASHLVVELCEIFPFPLERQRLPLCMSCLRVTLLRFHGYSFMVKRRGHHQAVGILAFGLL